ncbi:MAG: efflux RND transporter periplasmic adaptor subunit [Holosporales bacterium]|jgi:membrane fusion protein (multidrug efflux system)|nr:efflux RND transporter periplasmic adaptor subunit [Holosporales bacterium]
MLKKIVKFVVSSFSFWRECIASKDKGEFIRANGMRLAVQVIALLATMLVGAVMYSCMKPVVKGTCRIILQSDDNDGSGMFGRVVGVEAKRVTVGTTLREIRSIGVLKANAEIVIKAEINGKISEILFEEGSQVTKGQVLIKFEDDILKAEVAKARAEYELCASAAERAENLYKQKVGSKKDLEEATAKMKVAKAQLEYSEAQLRRATITAPCDGTIGIIKGAASPGNTVQSGAELVTVVDTSTMKIEFAIPAKYVPDIAAGQTVEITVDSSGNAGTYSGIVEAVDSVVDQRSHSILLKASIANKDDRLKHGMFANIRLVTGEKDDVILVDEDALDRVGSTEVVWVIDKKQMAHLKQVITGARDVNGVEILAGLKDGDWVVTSGQLKLTEGVLVNILNKEEESAEEDDEDEAEEPASKSEPPKEEETETAVESPKGSGDDSGKADKSPAEPEEKNGKPDDNKDDGNNDGSKEASAPGNADTKDKKDVVKDDAAKADKKDEGKDTGGIAGVVKSAIVKWFGNPKESPPETDVKQKEPSPKADEKQVGSEKAQ